MQTIFLHTDLMRIENRIHALTPRRKPKGIAACLLPFEMDGSISEASFSRSLERSYSVGLEVAVNMDTGYANFLTSAERTRILQRTRETLGPKPSFVAGVFVEGLEGDLVSLYRTQADEIVSLGGIPIFFQTTRFHAWGDQQVIDLYAEIARDYPAVYGFELGKMFAPNGLIFSERVIRGLMQIPEMKGIKHSSLDRSLALERLVIRDELRPDFRIFTGNDLGIDMIEYGSDYLLGLAAFCPDKFAERDRLWAEGDEAYYALSDALQYLGNVAFRDPVPAYKHSCAEFQYLLGQISSPRPHPRCPKRPSWEADMLRDCARRLGFNPPS